MKEELDRLEKLQKQQQKNSQKKPEITADNLFKDPKFYKGQNEELCINLQGENILIGGQIFRNLLLQEAKKNFDIYLSKHRVGELEAQFQSRAYSEGEKRNLRVRSLRKKNSIYIHTYNETNDIYKIDESGVSLSNEMNTHFIKPSTSIAMEVSKDSCSFEDIKGIFNIKEDTQAYLLIGLLLNCWFSEKPHLLTVFEGPQGCGKSTITKMFKEIVDPSHPTDRTPPDKEELLFIASKNNLVIAYDNLSYISKKMSDALCRILTGSAFTNRTLYTNTDETFLEYCRPIVLNGINSFIERSDLVDRSVFLYLKKISQVISPNELDEQFKELLPSIRRYLFDLLSNVLKKSPYIKNKENLPRMIDFYRLLYSMDKVHHFEDLRISTCYLENRNIALLKMIEEDIVTSEVVAYIQGYESLKIHTDALFDNVIQPLSTQKARFFPKSARARGNTLTRMIPLIESSGYQAKPFRDKKRGYIFTKINVENVSNVKGPEATDEIS